MDDPTKWEKQQDFWAAHPEPWTCFYCGRTPLKKGHKNKNSMATIDHYIPKHKAGSSSFKKNGVIACRACNRDKGVLMPDEWMVVLAHRKMKASEKETKE